MSESGTVYFIGCGVLGSDIKYLAKKLKLTLKKEFLPGGLHNRPDELHKRLQSAINKAGKDKSCIRIIVGYGLCGKGTVRIQAPNVPLIFPKVHDCTPSYLQDSPSHRTRNRSMSKGRMSTKL